MKRILMTLCAVLTIGAAAVAETLTDTHELGHDFAASLSGVQVKIDFADPISSLLTFNTHLLQTSDATLVSCAARLDAAANPGFFLSPNLIKISPCLVFRS